MESLDVERVLEGASTVGIAQGCLDAASGYVAGAAGVRREGSPSTS